MDFTFRKAELHDVSEIWQILKDAIERRKEDGSMQWQDGYPNERNIRDDIAKGAGYVLLETGTLIGYCALFINDEPAYAHIDGRWLTNGDFVLFHRLAISKTHVGKGIAKTILHNIEKFAIQHKIFSVRADTNFDNPAMIRTFLKMGYTYCGEVYFRGSARRAYEKVLTPPSSM